MYEDDRQTALSMYSQLFDEIGDDQALMQQLMSPTRQAVIIARSYDSKSKKLQVHAESRSGKSVIEEGTPKFVTAIEQIEEEALSLRAQRQPYMSENQISMFDSGNDSAASADDLYEDDEVTEADEDEAEPAEVPASEPEEDEASVDDAEEAPLEDVEDAPVEDVAVSDSSDEPEEAEEEDPVDAFISGLTIEGIKEPTKPKKPVIPVEDEDDEEDIEPVVTPNPRYYTERKPIVPLLVLYILFAIPIGLALIVLLLIPTAISLSVACVAIGAGAVSLTAAFSGFAVFADILIVLGCALLLLAVGLLFLWLFVWFIGGVMVSLVKGIIHLGDKLCYREVAA